MSSILPAQAYTLKLAPHRALVSMFKIRVSIIAKTAQTPTSRTNQRAAQPAFKRLF
jgi:hypothetical protein